MNISVVIPAYNVERWIAGAVLSVLQQRPAPHEVIVVDDGSTDSTAAVVSALGGCVMLLSQSNRGLAGARNRGIRAATGEVVYLLDADDEALPGAFEEILRVFEQTPEAGVVCGNFVKCDPEGNEEVAWRDHPGKAILGRPDVETLLLRNHLSPNSAFKTDVLKKYMFREELRACEDLDLWFRLLLDDVAIVTVAKPLCRYRVGRTDALSTQTLVMRRHRNFVFRWVLRDPRLVPRERMIALYQCLRSGLGIGVARLSFFRKSAASAGPKRLSVLQVAMDEPGGGRAHIEELQAGLEARMDSCVLGLPRMPLTTPSAWLRSRKAIRNAIKQQRPHIIHAHGVRAAAITLTTRSPAKRVVTIHGLHSLRRTSGGWGFVSRALNRSVLSRMSRIMVLSASDRCLLTEAGLDAGGIQMVRTAIREPARLKKEAARRSLGLDKDAFVILWLGRFEDEKDPLTFIAAMRLLQDASSVALMGGDGSLMPEVMDMLRSEDLEDRVLVPGWLSDPGPAFAAADIFVSTSLWEGFPLAALESAAGGLPLMVTDVAGNRDLVTRGLPARLVPAQDPERLAGELHVARAQSATQTDLMRNFGSWIVQEFSREHLAADVRDAYVAVLGESGAGPFEQGCSAPQDHDQTEVQVTWAD